jgi:phosphoribosylformylglycinamidine synthase II
VTAATGGTVPYTAQDFADEAARAALARRLAPLGIRLDALELGLLVERLGRVPRWAELVIMNTMWSEHCSYKSTRHLLSRLPTTAPQVVLGPGEDAGAVLLGEHAGKRWLLVVAHESHNHPSQIVPYEGAATGVGGIVRDVYCMGAEVTGVLDALRMGTGRRGNGLAAREILSGVVAGIADYGNALGVPNLGGDLEFDEGYDANVLVNVVALGVVEDSGLVHSRVPGPGDWAFVLCGKPTDASGFGGAAFSSGVLDAASDQRGAVQLPDPFLKRVLAVANAAVLARARQQGWAIGFKDLGAGGIACVTSELADHGGVGVEVFLDQAHRVTAPLAPEVVLCAETQERFCWVVPWAAREEVVAIYRDRFRLGDIYPGAGASVVGRSRADGVYRATWQGEAVVECPVSFLTSGVRCERPATAPAPTARAEGARPAAAGDDVPASRLDLAAEVATALASPALCSREPLFRRYDPEVRGVTFLRPGEADAGAIAPVPGAPFGLAVAVDGNPRLGRLDPFLGAARAVGESARNVAATGAWPWCLTDCLNYGRPTDPAVMGALEAGLDGLAAAAHGLGTLPLLERGDDVSAWCASVARKDLPPLPFVSGNVSLWNEDHDGRAVPPSPIVACFGLLPDVSNHSTPGLKAAGSVLLHVGPGRGALGGSLFAERHGRAGDPLPGFAPGDERSDLALVLAAHVHGLVRAAHDVSDGGLVQALAEMAFLGRAGCGFAADVGPLVARGVAAAEHAWFSEEPGFVLEVPEEARVDLDSWADALGARLTPIGRVTAAPGWSLSTPGRAPVEIDPAPLHAAWSTALDDAFVVVDEALA